MLNLSGWSEYHGSDAQTQRGFLFGCVLLIYLTIFWLAQTTCRHDEPRQSEGAFTALNPSKWSQERDAHERTQKTAGHWESDWLVLTLTLNSDCGAIWRVTDPTRPPHPDGADANQTGYVSQTH